MVGDAPIRSRIHHRPWTIPLDSELRRLLRLVTLNDEAALSDVMSGRVPGGPSLDQKTKSLVIVAGLIALDATTASLHAAVDNAFAAGASDEEILEVVLAVAPVVGSSRISAMLPRIQVALDRD